MIAILTGVKLYLIMVLVCISLTIGQVEHLFMSQLAICMSSLEKCLFRSSTYLFLGCLFFWYWVVRPVYIYFGSINPLSFTSFEYFHRFSRFPFSFSWWLPFLCKGFLFKLIYFILFILFFWLRWVFVAARGLFSGGGEQGLLFVAVHRLPFAVASLAVEHGL